MGSTGFVLEKHRPATADDASIVVFHELWTGEFRESRPLDPVVPLDVLSAAVRSFPEFMDTVVFLARDDDGEAAGFAMVIHRKTNVDPHAGEMRMWAKPAYRRRGLAAALLAEVCQDAAERDLRTLTCTTTEGIGWGDELCRAVGSVASQKRRTWRLPVEKLDRNHIRSLAAQAAERARGYEVIDTTSPLPDELVADAVDLLHFLNPQATGPDDNLPPTLTVDALRQLENTWQAMGQGRRWQFVRHDGSGALAAVIDAVWHPSVSHMVAQDHLVVRPEFRGRNLGLWMKAGMIDSVLDAWPEAEEFRTTTALPNPAMDSVDERLGFVPYLATTVWKAEVDEVRRWLASGRAANA